MSASSLEQFLRTLQRELNSEKGGAYRSEVADIRPHFYRFRVGDLVTETKKQFEKKEIPITEEEKAVFRQFAIAMKDELVSRLSEVKNVGTLKVTDLTIELTFMSNTDTGALLTKEQRQSQYRDANSAFQRIRELYRQPLEKYFKKVQDFMRTQTMVNEKTGRTKSKVLRTKGQREKQGVRHVFDAGHIGEAGIIQSKVSDAFSDAALDVYDEGSGDLATLKDDLKELGVKLSIIRDDATDSHRIQIESASRNRAAGARMKRKKKAFEMQIAKAIAKLENKHGPALSKLKGSDTLQQKKTKESIDKVMKPLQGLKKPKSGSVKVTKEDTKRKKSSKKPKSKIVTPKLKSGAKKNYGAAGAKIRQQRAVTKSSGAASSPLALIQEFNRRLPSAILDNMRAPALENRTGRFAASVRVVNILQTAKGFPSIGYTYMRSPYETFEVGGAQGSVEKDPRRLIDKTIREIAAEAAMGRLFTRRV